MKIVSPLSEPHTDVFINRLNLAPLRGPGILIWGTPDLIELTRPSKLQASGSLYPHIITALLVLEKYYACPGLNREGRDEQGV